MFVVGRALRHVIRPGLGAVVRTICDEYDGVVRTRTRAHNANRGRIVPIFRKHRPFRVCDLLNESLG